MKTFELKVHLDSLMRETGQGSKDVCFLTEEGEVYEIDQVSYDEENDCFFIHGVIKDE